MYADVMNYVNICLQCAIVEGTGRKQKPLLQPIVTERPFQIVGVDIMEGTLLLLEEINMQ